jgi:gamma-glutamylcyclotransferase (GGCT)/AIG2-like uncharacterized protein YtfP
MSTETLVFVYGTLKSGGCRAHVLAGQRCLGAARTKPCYRIYNCGTYPGLVERESGLAIEGELWQVDGRCLKQLDDVEGVADRLYERRPVQLQPPFAEVRAEAYFYLRPVTDLPDCGPCWWN